jgi:hypothetical protein
LHERKLARRRVGLRPRRYCLGVTDHPNGIRWHCPECLHEWEDRLWFRDGTPWDAALAKKMAAYWSRENGGASVVCPRCLQARYQEIDVRYGLLEAVEESDDDE